MARIVITKLIKGVADHFITRLPEWIWAIILLNFGLTLLGPHDTFQENSNFAIMARMADENTWGFALTLIGGLRLLALLVNGTFEPFSFWTPLARALGATLSCFAWFLITLGLLLANPNAVGWKTYAGILFGDMIVAILVAGDFGKAVRTRRRKNGSA